METPKSLARVEAYNKGSFEGSCEGYIWVPGRTPMMCKGSVKSLQGLGFRMSGFGILVFRGVQGLRLQPRITEPYDDVGSICLLHDFRVSGSTICLYEARRGAFWLGFAEHPKHQAPPQSMPHVLCRPQPHTAPQSPCKARLQPKTKPSKHLSHTPETQIKLKI